MVRNSVDDNVKGTIAKAAQKCSIVHDRAASLRTWLGLDIPRQCAVTDMLSWSEVYCSDRRIFNCSPNVWYDETVHNGVCCNAGHRLDNTSSKSLTGGCIDSCMSCKMACVVCTTVRPFRSCNKYLAMTSSKSLPPNRSSPSLPMTST